MLRSKLHPVKKACTLISHVGFPNAAAYEELTYEEIMRVLSQKTDLQACLYFCSRERVRCIAGSDFNDHDGEALRKSINCWCDQRWRDYQRVKFEVFREEPDLNELPELFEHLLKLFLFEGKTTLFVRQAAGRIQRCSKGHRSVEEVVRWIFLIGKVVPEKFSTKRAEQGWVVKKNKHMTPIAAKQILDERIPQRLDRLRQDWQSRRGRLPE